MLNHKVAIVFPVFNGLEYTKNCLYTLYNHNKIDENKLIQVVIVDDGSTDGSSSWISENYPQVHLIMGDGSLWWSGGVNKGIGYILKNLDSEYILWWNNDIIADKDYFANLNSLLGKVDDQTIVGSKIYKDDKFNTIWSMGGVFDPHSGKKYMIGADEPESDRYQELISCDWLTGMGTVTHRSVYEKIGLIDDENFPQYHGDLEFTYRAKLNGYKIMVHPSLKIYNDTRHSGIKHNNNLAKFYQSLFSLKSSYNISRDLKLYRIYSKSPKAYSALIKKYYFYIGGFVKWQILGMFGKSK
jgi:GT2 family glycosyltransferase